MEGLLLNLMYDIPDKKDVSEIIINEKAVNGESEPLLIRKPDSKSA